METASPAALGAQREPAHGGEGVGRLRGAENVLPVRGGEGAHGLVPCCCASVDQRGRLG